MAKNVLRSPEQFGIPLKRMNVCSNTNFLPQFRELRSTVLNGSKNIQFVLMVRRAD